MVLKGVFMERTYPLFRDRIDAGLKLFAFVACPVLMTMADYRQGDSTDVLLLSVVIAAFVLSLIVVSLRAALATAEAELGKQGIVKWGGGYIPKDQIPGSSNGG